MMKRKSADNDSWFWTTREPIKSTAGTTSAVPLLVQCSSLTSGGRCRNNLSCFSVSVMWWSVLWDDATHTPLCVELHLNEKLLIEALRLSLHLQLQVIIMDWYPPLPLQVVKVESGVPGAPDLNPTQTNELHFLRSRVRELERDKAGLSAENQRLKTMLVHGESRSPVLSAHR